MSAVFWIVIGRKNTGSRDKPVRIDRMHYFEEDDHECSVCGARFRGNSMTCPRCRTKFTGTRDEDDEFIEEMELLDDDD